MADPISGSAPDDGAAEGGIPAPGEASGTVSPPRLAALRGGLLRIGGSWRLWGSLCVAVLITSAFLWVDAPREPEPVTHVREFLTAVREKRVADALELAGVHREKGEAGRFVTAEALDGGWEIVALDVFNHFAAYDQDDVEDAEVQVAIRAGDAVKTFLLYLEKPHGKWKITNPFRSVTFPATGLLYVEVNGMKAAMPRLAEQSDEYLLFPGVYRLYSNIPGIAEIASKPTLVVPTANYGDTRRTTPMEIDATMTRITPNGERVIRDVVRQHIDRCAGGSALATVDCPFGADPVFGPAAPGHPRGSTTSLRNITWKVVEYPELAIVPRLGGIQVANRTPGSIQLTVTGTDRETGGSVTYTATCTTRLNDYSMLVTKDAEVLLVPPYRRLKPASGEVNDRLLQTDTCRGYP